MKSETSTQHQNESSKDITCGVITLSDKKKKKKADLSGEYISKEIEARYTLSKRNIIPDEKDDLINAIEGMVSDNIDVILTTGGTGLDSRDITVETVEKLFEKRLDGFGEVAVRHHDIISLGKIVTEILRIKELSAYPVYIGIKCIGRTRNLLVRSYSQEQCGEHIACT